MPSLHLAITRLINTGKNNFAISVVKAPYPSAYVHDCLWTAELSQLWQEWRQMFGESCCINDTDNPLLFKLDLPSSDGLPPSYSGRLMQFLGISLWRWVFDGPILMSLERSCGIAMGQGKPLSLRLEIRDPDLIAIPWEIMLRPDQSTIISLSQNLLFSRTTSEVESLPSLRTAQAINILLVLGHDENLQLQQEATTLQQILANDPQMSFNSPGFAPCMVKTLIQPTPQELIQELETKLYNVFFYAGHGLPNPDGGLLFLRQDQTLNGIELAQALIRSGLKLAVFNACWGAQPAVDNRKAIPNSSLAEVLIRHGVPAVLGMRDEIADHESHSFIKAFATALRSRKSIDEAVLAARQEMLTLHKFNQPAWTLPVLYLHPDFNGELVKGTDRDITELPDISTINVNFPISRACLRSLSPGGKTWFLRTGVTRIGRHQDNDIVIPEPSVSSRHAEILCRSTFADPNPVQTYYLQDISTYGATWCLSSHGWLRILREEVPLKPGMQLKFGSSRGETWEFIIEN